MFIIKLLSQHVSGIIMPIIRRTHHQENIFQASLCRLLGENVEINFDGHNDARKMFSWW